MKNRRLGCHALMLTVFISTPAFSTLPEKPWDCIRRVLEQLTPERDPLPDAIEKVHAALNYRDDVTAVSESVSEGSITVFVKTAEEYRYIDRRFGLKGFAGYGVSPELSLLLPGERQIPVGSPREREALVQKSSLSYLPDGVALDLAGKTVSFHLLRPASAESKINSSLRAQLASDDFRADGYWNPERRILVTVHPARMHWHFYNVSRMEDGSIPTPDDIKKQLPSTVKDFKRQYAQEAGLNVVQQRPIVNGLAERLMITVSSQPGLVRLLSDPNVISAEAVEHFDQYYPPE